MGQPRQKTTLDKKTLDPGVKNIQRKNLVDPKKLLFPPLHIKLGLIKQFVKVLPKESECFKYLSDQFPGLTKQKLKEGVFVKPDIRKMMKNENFERKKKKKESLEIFETCLLLLVFLETRKAQTTNLL